MKNELLDRKVARLSLSGPGDVRVCSEKYKNLEAMCFDSAVHWTSKKLGLGILENGEMETATWIKRLNEGESETITIRLLDENNRKKGHIIFLGCKLSDAIYSNNGIWAWRVILDYQKTKFIDCIN